jgi:hypothetical protein
MEHHNERDRNSNDPIVEAGDPTDFLQEAEALDAAVRDALHAVEEHENCKDIPSGAHGLAHLEVLYVEFLDWCLEDPNDGHGHERPGKGDARYHIWDLTGDVNSVLADVLACEEIQSGREANWNHVGEEAKVTENSLGRDIGGVELRSQQSEDIEGPPPCDAD